jgi:hypothetical protein
VEKPDRLINCSVSRRERNTDKASICLDFSARNGLSRLKHDEKRWLGNKLRKRNNKDKIIPGWKLRSTIDSAMGSESMKRINKWNGHTDEIADTGLIEIMGRTGNRVQSTKDEIVVSTSGCKHRYLY